MVHQIYREKKFQYIEEGEGEILILLHGLFGALSNWEDVISYFSKKYRVIVPLLPIYEMALHELGVKGLARFVRDFVEFKDFRNITLLGNSLGGHVALVYMAYFPERVKAMVLTGSSGLYENAMGGTYPKRGSIEYIREKVEFTFYDPSTATPELVDEVFKITNNRLKIIRILILAKSAIRYNMRDEISKMDVPVCLIWGKQDKVTPPDVAEEFHTLLPRSELFWIDKCGHAPMMERPKEFNAYLDPFLEKLFSGGPV